MLPPSLIHCKPRQAKDSVYPAVLKSLSPVSCVLNPLGVLPRVTPTAAISGSEREDPQRHSSTMINEFVLSVRPASCQPRSLVIKLPLVNVLNTD